jgi:hypothetical protein
MSDAVGLSANISSKRSMLMKLHDRWLIKPWLVLTVTLLCVPATCRAQLLPPGDFNGKSLEEWTLDWGEWSIATGLGGQTLPDTVDGVRYLPPNLGNVFVADLTIQQGTAVVFSPYFVFGETYDAGSDDLPSDIADFMLFENATFETSFDGSVVLDGLASAFPARKTGVRSFAQPILYAVPQDRGGRNAIGAIFEQGLGAMFELPLGQHTIMNVYESTFFGGPFSATYNITVVPEPASFILIGIGALALVGCVRRRRARAGG